MKQVKVKRKVNNICKLKMKYVFILYSNMNMEHKEEDQEVINEDVNCTICGERRRAETATFVCEHKFCQECIVLWYRKCVTERRHPTCPLCRKVDNIWGSR